jgi:hypothetical protein
MKRIIILFIFSLSLLSLFYNQREKIDPNYMEKLQWLHGGFIQRIFKAGKAPKMNDDATEAESARKAAAASENMKAMDMVCQSHFFFFFFFLLCFFSSFDVKGKSASY